MLGGVSGELWVGELWVGGEGGITHGGRLGLGVERWFEVGVFRWEGKCSRKGRLQSGRAKVRW